MPENSDQDAGAAEVPADEAEQTPLDPNVPPVSDEAQAIAQQLHANPPAVITEHGEGITVADLDSEAEAQERQAAEFSALVAEARPILLRDFNGTVCLEGGWPAVAQVASAMLQGDFALVDGDSLTLTLANARAVYTLACCTADNKTRIYRLTDDHTSPVLAPSLQVGGMASTQTGNLDAKGAEILETLEDPKEQAAEHAGLAIAATVDAAAEEVLSKPRTQGLVTEVPPGPDPNVKCPECKLYGNRHRPSCSRAA